ncbi:hypothetical protein P7K49_018616 [Saguinus oedipus]|uniref:Uncharacterized protein n=1 Tax=Saguinus oedipus TaxID=9490 RepID=A0ABQ9V6T9_SAGOE|nr:hypothetical protein P7K49_018616 [Saguinus oedipus]
MVDLQLVVQSSSHSLGEEDRRLLTVPPQVQALRGVSWRHRQNLPSPGFLGSSHPETRKAQVAPAPHVMTPMSERVAKGHQGKVSGQVSLSVRIQAPVHLCS